ncbi:hypothetical protein [Actibacterium sp.]|uniref:hypothetical protein n=1 Tax=Actibacterium sp. TaxID=1872125 RepID=UPI0035690165
MTQTPAVQFDPAPPRGLSRSDFSMIASGGLGDGHNNYAHSMAWFKGKLYLGSTRSNMCMLRFQSAFQDAPLVMWPVDCPDTRDELYKLDFSSQIWCYDPETRAWEMVFRAPLVEGSDGNPTPREIGYRSMVVFQGTSDPEPALYISAWAPGRAPGGLILRSTDGKTFEPVSDYGILDTPISTTRCLTAFKGRMFFAPTARRGTEGGQQNTAGLPLVFESADPASRNWIAASEPGFGEAGNLGIFTLCVMGDRLYAGTLNLEGFQVWASDCEGKPPYRWTKIVDQGAGRGPLNQAVASMAEFKGALYVGSGIQGGGNDRVNNIGPAAAELVRVNADDSWDVIVGDRRTVDGKDVYSLSGLRAGFGNFFNGYMWNLGTHDGWLYCGTYDWSINLRWSTLEQTPPKVKQLMNIIGAEGIIGQEGGADLWRSYDGENWLPVTRQGFDNPYNWGVRNIVSTPVGLFVGTANVFGPRVAAQTDGEWAYQDNPRGGLEVWLGQNPQEAEADA